VVFPSLISTVPGRVRSLHSRENVPPSNSRPSTADSQLQKAPSPLSTVEDVLCMIDRAHLQDLRYCYKVREAVPQPLIDLMSAILLLILPNKQDVDWRTIQHCLKNADEFISRLHEVARMSHTCNITSAQRFLKAHPAVQPAKLRRINPTAGFLCQWLFSAIQNAEDSKPNAHKLAQVLLRSDRCSALPGCPRCSQWRALDASVHRKFAAHKRRSGAPWCSRSTPMSVPPTCLGVPQAAARRHPTIKLT
jgi:hypothetical protein